MTDIEFVNIWNAATSVSEVCQLTGYRRGSACTRAHRLRRSGWQLKKMPWTYPVSVVERFWKFVNKTSGCWLWTGSVDPNGYGRISQGSRGKRPLHPHRLSWEIHRGVIPDGQCVLHKCDNPPRVRPDHLFLGTMKDNTHDMMQKQRGHWQKNAPHKILAEL